MLWVGTGNLSEFDLVISNISFLNDSKSFFVTSAVVVSVACSFFTGGEGVTLVVVVVVEGGLLLVEGTSSLKLNFLILRITRRISVRAVELGATGVELVGVLREGLVARLETFLEMFLSSGVVFVKYSLSSGVVSLIARRSSARADLVGGIIVELVGLVTVELVGAVSYSGFISETFLEMFLNPGLVQSVPENTKNNVRDKIKKNNQYSIEILTVFIIAAMIVLRLLLRR